MTSSCNQTTQTRETAEQYFNSGFDKFNLEDYKGAIADYTKAIKLNPKYAPAYHNRAEAKFNLEDYKGAMEDVNKAINFNPKYAPAYHNRAKFKTKFEDYKGAIEDYTTAIKLDPEYAEAYFNRGYIYFNNLGNIESACLDFCKAAELGHSYASYYVRNNCQ